jgi:hypothetical protein
LKAIIALVLLFSIAIAGGMQCPVSSAPSSHRAAGPDFDLPSQFARRANSLRAAEPSPGSLIDRHIFGKLDEMGVMPAFMTSDEEFIRRVSLDLTGRIPSGERVIQFLADNTSDKRERLVDELIASDAFTDKWTFWLGELLANTSNHGGVTADGRNLLHQQLRNAISSGTPYDRLVTDLITARGPISENGFVTFISRRTSANEPIQDTWDDLAADSGRVFLGMPLLCLSCHNGARHLEQVNEYLSTKTREEFWSQAAFFSRIAIERTKEAVDSKPLRFSDAESGEYETDTAANPGMRPLRGNGTYAPAFLLTGERPSGPDYRAEFARMLTSDFQFARATVNRLWAELFGMGIVDPPDGFDLARYETQASHPELLDLLAADFKSNGFDLRHAIRGMVSSNAYQLSSRYSAEWKESYRPLFARRIVRRLDAEQIHDSILQATGVTTGYDVAGLSSPVIWATQLPDVNEPRTNAEASLFLDILGRGRRMDDYGFRSSEVSIAGSLSTMSSPFVTSRTTLANSPVLQRLFENFDDDGFLDQLFLHTLSRLPTSLEKQTALTRRGDDRSRWAEQLLWALINRNEFLANY